MTGCAVRKEIASIKNDSAYLRTQVDSLRGELLSLRSLTEQSVEAANRMRADTQAQLNQVAEQTQLLSDRLEDTGRRISNLPAKLRFVGPPAPVAVDTTSKNVVADSSRIAAPPNPAESQLVYEAAYQDLVKGKYDLARQGLQQYLQMEPQGALADNAHYWIGESYYSQKNYEEANKEFSLVLEKFPDDDKAPSAMLKLAYAQIASGKSVAGKKNLEALIKRFPQSNEANLAKSRLQELR